MAFQNILLVYHKMPRGDTKQDRPKNKALSSSLNCNLLLTFFWLWALHENACAHI